MNNIGNKLRILREQKNLSQENLAFELGITQPSYARLEKEGDNISIKRLIQIASILKTTVSEIIDEKTQKIINQQNSEYESAYIDTIINSNKDHINTLKEEILFLRRIIENKD
ncbi:MAG: helix-turn-helix domain-containing protein [Flavobacterium sp.]